MKSQEKIYREVFENFLIADKNIWIAIQKILDEDEENEELKVLVKPLMLLRGEIHMEFMRPIYKKYPELAKEAGFGDDAY